MSEITDFITARLDEDEAHAQKDLWCADRATEGWEAHPGYNLPYSDLHAGGQVIARFTGTRGEPLADGEDDQHQADLMLAARMAKAARPRAVRMLRDVEAKRALIAGIVQANEVSDGPDNIQIDGWLAEAWLKLLALPYSDHPGYREEWKP